MNTEDEDHRVVRRGFEQDGGPYVVPAGLLAEVTYVIESRLGWRVHDAFLVDLENGDYQLDCGENDISRIRVLVNRYADLPLGFADACVVACAERHGGRILTLDRRHFPVVAAEGRISVVPD